MSWWRTQTDLDDDQKAVTMLPIDGRWMVSGPPGSGKTNILVVRGGYLFGAGYKNLLLLTFTRVLSEFIRSGCGDYVQLPPDRVNTFAGWSRTFVRERGLKIPKEVREMDIDDSRGALVTLLSEAVNGLRPDFYDAILVDEVQDLWQRELQILSNLSQRLFVVGDANQRIFGANEGIAAASALGCQVRTLTHHYRIGPKICAVADRLRVETTGPSLLATEHYADKARYPDRVDVHPCPSLDAAIDLMTDTLRTQLLAYPEDWLGVIVPRNDLRAIVAGRLDDAGLGEVYKVLGSDVDEPSYDPRRRICILTLQAAKGTEFRVVHLLAADDIPYYTVEKAFVAVTRARTALDVYHVRSLEPSFASALAERTAPRLPLP